MGRFEFVSDGGRKQSKGVELLRSRFDTRVRYGIDIHESTTIIFSLGCDIIVATGNNKNASGNVVFICMSL